MNLKTAVISFATLSLACAAGLAQPPVFAQAEVLATPDAEQPAPVQLLDLTDSSGTTTEIAKAGLEAEQKEAVQESETQAPASNSGGTAISPTMRTRLLQALAPSGKAGPVDPEADATLLTKPMEVEEFLVAGFAWNEGAELPEGAQVFLRVREHGTWSKWFRNEVDASAGPDSAPTRGTEEIVTAGADAVQASVVLPSVSELRNLPKGLHLVLVPSRPEGEKAKQSADLPTVSAEKTAVAEEQDNDALSQPADAATKDAEATSSDGSAQDGPSSSATSAPLPAGTSGGAAVGLTTNTLQRAVVGASGLPVEVNTRADWGANESLMEWDRNYAPAKHVVVHHTAGSNAYTASQSASIVRGIYYYHSQTLGWGDIGYNFLVDKFGQVFEGRYGTLASAAGQMVAGAHARGVNTGSMGISMMGDYSNIDPTSTQLDKVGKLAGWFLGRAGLEDARGNAPLAIQITERYRAGQSVNLPVILAHRDVGYTACPGERGYSKMGQIRQIADDFLKPTAATGLERNGSSPESGEAKLIAGWNHIDGSWYYVGPDGKTKLTGWQKVGKHWFHLSASGAMSTGWLADRGKWYYLRPTNGDMLTGWFRDGNSWFYLDRTNGDMHTGWFKDGSNWYYLEPTNGDMRSGWVNAGGAWYYLNPATGQMAEGWVSTGGHWYYLTPRSGHMAQGWVLDRGVWYWLVPGSGAMATSQTVTEGRLSNFNSSGAWMGYAAAGAAAARNASYTNGSQSSTALLPVMAAPSGSRAVVVSKMVKAFESSGASYPSATFSRGGAPTAWSFFSMVYDEAVAEGVSPELLFAQVVKETGWFRFGGDVSARQFNFGGLGAVGGGAAGNSFPDVRTGLRAQVQHLRAYGDATVNTSNLAHAVVDPRFVYVRKGAAPYVEHLGIQENPAHVGWATARGYGTDLAALIRQYFG